MRLLTLLGLFAALAAGQTRYARLGEFQGPVEVQLSAADPWIPAERNLPLTESAWVRTGAGAHLEIELDDGSDWRLGPDSQGEISDYTRLSTGQRVTLLSIDHGTAYFSGQPAAKDVVMIVMPGAQVTVLQGSRLRQTVQATWSQVAVLEGQVRFSSPAAEMDVHEGTTARVEPAFASRFFLYPEVTAEPLDRWSEERDKVQSAPQSASHVTARYGLADLDADGKWLHTDDFGLVWKPEVAADWAPYRNGRWRYFDTAGYTWVSDDRWGWLPYHNGRWARKADLGWVWQPAVTASFHPGEVYWQRGAAFAGWGPLAPGETWTAPGGPSQAYATGVTTYAAFQPDLRIIASTGFATPEAEQLKAAAFVTALPSPAFLAWRLEATRPALKAGRTRVIPSVYGVTFGDGPAPAATPEPPTNTVSITPPTALADTSAEAGPPADGVYAVTVPVVVEVPVHKDGVRRAGTTAAVPAPVVTPSAAPPVKPPVTPVQERPPFGIPGPPRGPKAILPTMSSEEREIYQQVLQDVSPAAPKFPKALADLNTWTREFPNTAFPNDRAYYYIHVYNSTSRFDKVLDTAEPLVVAGVTTAFRDPQQVLQVLVAASTSVLKIAIPTVQQWAVAQNAARQLLDFLPVYFEPRRKPSDVTADAWAIMRAQLESGARQTLAKRTAGKTGMR